MILRRGRKVKYNPAYAGRKDIKFHPLEIFAN